jgi:hypothetical protein
MVDDPRAMDLPVTSSPEPPVTVGPLWQRQRVPLALSLATAAAIALTACAVPVSAPTTPAAAVTPTSAAAQALAALPVKGRAPQTGYSRAQFGEKWKDIDRDGCDQRNQVLARDLVDETLRGRCVVLTGTLRSVYTGKSVPFVRGAETSDDVQIDHVVALSAAWQTGAQEISLAEREQFANDPLNLQAVEGPVNQAKGDSDAASWLPPAKPGWCGYVARQIAVKAKYRLWVTAPERDAMAHVLGTCPAEGLPT